LQYKNTNRKNNNLKMDSTISKSHTPPIMDIIDVIDIINVIDIKDLQSHIISNVDRFILIYLANYDHHNICHMIN
jgi:hypothetical protein